MWVEFWFIIILWELHRKFVAVGLQSRSFKLAHGLIKLEYLGLFPAESMDYF